MRSDTALLLQQKIRSGVIELRQLGASRRDASIQLPVLHRTGADRVRPVADVVILELPEAEAVA